jgi:stage III sporulation protein SpoIIIAA
VLETHARLYELLEVVMDLGRPPMARFPGHDEALSEVAVTQEDLDYATQQVRNTADRVVCRLGLLISRRFCVSGVGGA